MTQVQSEITRLRNEARQALATVLADQALKLEANINKAKQTIARDEELVATIKAINVNDRDSVATYFGHGYGGVHYQMGDKAVDIQSLLTRI